MGDGKRPLDPAEFVTKVLDKPSLVIHAGNLPATAAALRDLLAASGRFFVAVACRCASSCLRMAGYHL
jgi:hypothetical protein